MILKISLALVAALLLSMATLMNALPKVADLQALSDDEIFALVRGDMSMLEDPDLHAFIYARLSVNPKYSKYTGAQDRPAVLNGQQCEAFGNICDVPDRRRILEGLEERAALTGDKEKYAPLRRVLQAKVCCPGLDCVDGPYGIFDVCLPKQCRPAFGISKARCTRLRKSCANFDIEMKWTGKGCRKNGKIVGDGGCQCKDYCGYTCQQSCNADKACKWNGGVCQFKASGENGTAVPYCYPPFET